MTSDLIYWQHKLPQGIEVIEICGGDSYSDKLWRALAMQLVSEHSDDGLRTVSHFPNGAPSLIGENRRVSLTHTGRFLALAIGPEVEGDEVGECFLPSCALGIDAERCDRQQVIRIRERFLSSEELEMIDAEDVEANVRAWTIKEAVYKAMLTPGVDFRKEIHIVEMPEIKSRKKGVATCRGHRFTLCSWHSEEVCLTAAFVNS